MYNDTYINSLCNNQHTFNIAKYYKQAFTNIPILNKYDVIIWIDRSIEIIYKKTSEYILKKIYSEKKIGWNHEYRYGILSKEVEDSHFNRYTSTYWNNQLQPYQDIDKQYSDYVNDGYTDLFFLNIKPYKPHLGVWVTCFVAFLKNDLYVKKIFRFMVFTNIKIYNTRLNRVFICLSKNEYYTIYFT